VRCLFELLQSSELDIRLLPKLMVAGAGTAKALAQHGLKPDLMPPGKYSAASMIEVAREAVPQAARVLRLRSDKAGTMLSDALTELGAQVRDCVLYQNERIDYDRLPAFEAVFFASSSAVESFESQWGVDALAGKTVVSIGKPTVEALEARGVAVDIIGPEATVESSLTALAEACVNEWICNA
jgi:uroporphyrinogen-III synthase